MADIDGDGAAEVVISTYPELLALDWTAGGFAVKWRLPVNSGGHGSGTSSAYDFDGDGAAEVIYADDDWIYIIAGDSGTPREQIPSRGVHSHLTGAIVVDIDNDCRPDVLLTGVGPRNAEDSRILVYGCDQGRPPRSIWNQIWYHVTNVNDDGTVPRVETAPWTASNSCRAQVASSDPVPGTAGNTLLGVRAGTHVVLSWGVAPGGARSYTLHRGTVKGVWPAPPFMPGIAARTATLNDLPSPPRVYFYRVAGANCAGVEGP